MILTRLFCSLALLAVCLGFSAIAHADSWLPPKASVTYESAAKDARFTVIVKQFPSSLAASTGVVSIIKGGVDKTTWVEIWRGPLQNKLSPVTALIANGGWRVVTFDNYYSVGYGEEVIVFYDEQGNLLKKYSLETLLTSKELGQVARSVSSRWWRKAAVIDEALGLLKVQVGLNQEEHGHIAATKTISFNLLDGEILTP
jgi:hypothetical protein